MCVVLKRKRESTFKKWDKSLHGKRDSNSCLEFLYVLRFVLKLLHVKKRRLNLAVYDKLKFIVLFTVKQASAK